jgi:hypothetical protein
MLRYNIKRYKGKIQVRKGPRYIKARKRQGMLK